MLLLAQFGESNIPVALKGMHFAVTSSYLPMDQQKIPSVFVWPMFIWTLCQSILLSALTSSQLSRIISALPAMLVAGEIKPVLPDNDMLVGANNLLDGWCELRPSEAGSTWS